MHRMHFLASLFSTQSAVAFTRMTWFIPCWLVQKSTRIVYRMKWRNKMFQPCWLLLHRPLNLVHSLLVLSMSCGTVQKSRLSDEVDETKCSNHAGSCFIVRWILFIPVGSKYVVWHCSKKPIIGWNGKISWTKYIDENKISEVNFHLLWSITTY